MRFQCISLRSSATGNELDSSPWLTLDREYTVISIEADYSGPTRLHLITDDAENFGLFDADCFLTIDQSVPSNWVARIR